MFFGGKHRCYQSDKVPTMTSAHDNKRDHVLREPLEKAVAQAIANNADTKQLVETILLELDEQHLIAYTPKSKVNLFTPAGRLLIMLIERPGLTVREMSVTLGCSTTAVIKALSLLDKDKVITRTKVKGRYEYRINYKNARYHPDLRRLIFSLRAIITEEHPLPSDLFKPNTPG